MSIHFEMQVNIDGEWISVKCSGAEKPYQYSTYDEAYNMLQICYPDQIREHRLGGPQTVRVQEIQS